MGVGIGAILTGVSLLNWRWSVSAPVISIPSPRLNRVSFSAILSAQPVSKVEVPPLKFASLPSPHIFTSGVGKPSSVFIGNTVGSIFPQSHATSSVPLLTVSLLSQRAGLVYSVPDSSLFTGSRMVSVAFDKVISSARIHRVFTVPPEMLTMSGNILPV